VSSGDVGGPRPERAAIVAPRGFLFDENAESRIGRALQALGYDVTTIAHDYPASLADREILALAVAEDRILVTNDRDFGDLIFRQGQPHRGVIYFRLPLDSTADEKIEQIKRLLVTHRDQLDRFLVVTPRGVRVR
jgi:predicted nuclease of predicted toxin-antitoxin system